MKNIIFFESSNRQRNQNLHCIEKRFFVIEIIYNGSIFRLNDDCKK